MSGRSRDHRLDGFLAVGRLADDEEPGGFEQHPGLGAEGGVVVDEQQRGAAHAGSPAVSERSSISTARTRRWVSADASRPSFWKIWWTWFSTVFGLMIEGAGDRLVGPPLGHLGQHLALAVGEHVEWAVLAAALHQPRHDRRVDHALALVDAPQRVGEHRHVRHPLLEQVADPVGDVLEHPDGVADVEVLGQHEHPDGRMVAADRLGGDDPLVGVRRRHLDVDDDHVGRVVGDAAEQLRRRWRPWSTTSNPDSVSRRASPSRSSIESSATATRTAARPSS